MKSKSILAVAALVLACVAVGYAVHLFYSATPVRIVELAEGPIEEFVDERGTTRLPRTYLITMPYAGRIAEIPTEEGATVTRGQVVAEVVPIDLELDVEEARAVVERLAAAIRQNEYQSIEQTALQQAKQFVESMKATVAAAATRVESGRARLNYTEKQLQRTKELYSTKTETEDSLDRAMLETVEASVDFRQDELVHSAMQSLAAATNLLPTMILQFIERKNLTGEVLNREQAEASARLRQVEQAKTRGTMRSPVDGVVLNRWVTNERFLAAGEKLLEIGHLEDLQVEADVLSLDVVNVNRGDLVEIHGPTIGQPAARGTVARVYPAGFTKISSLGVEQQRVKVIIDLAPEDLARLRERRNVGVGYRVRARIITRSAPKAQVVPRSALFRGPEGQWQVFAVEGGKARRVDVTIGLMNDTRVEIVEPLQAGDRVIVEPQSALADGQRVKAR